MFEHIKNLCSRILEMGIPGFDLIVYQHGRCVLRYMGGYADLEKRLPVTGKERYHIYSCSKPITCAAAMQLWERGLFDLEEPLAKYLPEFTEMKVQTEDGVRKAENPILIRHLFEMTAGFSYDVHSPWLEVLRQETNGRCPTRESMKYLAREPLLFEPGAQWNYSLCHDVLAALVEVLSGQRFEDYVRVHIFEPLGMEASTFLPTDADLESLTPQYRFKNGQAVECGTGNSYRLGSEYASGGAGCVSTVEDYIKFLEALRTGSILKPETVALMATDRLTEAQRATYTKAETHGYGLGIRTPKADGTALDFGWGGAAGAYLAVDPAHDLTLYYGQQLLSSPAQGIRIQIYEQVLADLLGEEVSSVEPASLADYTYTY